MQKPPQSLISWHLQPISLFLDNRGKQLCEVDDADEWLTENGFGVKQKWIEQNMVFVEIDKETTKLSDFYSFEELTKQQQKGTEECWKTFFLLDSEEEKESCKSWNENIEAPFLKVLNSIQMKYKYN